MSGGEALPFLIGGRMAGWHPTDLLVRDGHASEPTAACAGRAAYDAGEDRDQ